MMPSIELPIGTATSVAFFTISAIAAYFTPEYPPMRWFAASAFAFFVVLGPMRWLANTDLQIIDDLSPFLSLLRISGIVTGVALGILGVAEAF